jgi:hypothetical protein
MTISIEHCKVKRQITGSGFNICGSKEDLLSIACQIKQAVERDFAYGWVRVRDVQNDEHFAGSSVASIPWAEVSNLQTT